MVQMSDGLKKVAGHKLKVVLETMTKNTYIGFAVGALVTAFIQSSSATTVIVIGLVNAGLLGFSKHREREFVARSFSCLSWTIVFPSCLLGIRHLGAYRCMSC